MVQAQFSWMPDARHVVVASVAGQGEDQGLQLLDTKTGSFRPFLPSATPVTWVSVSRNGSRIAYSARNRQYELLDIPLSSAPPAPLAHSYIDQHSLAISPTRDEYAFVRLNQLVVRGRIRGDERILMSSADFPLAVSQLRFTWLEYSHDGDRLLFSCHGCEKEVSLWVLPIAGGSPARIAGGSKGGYYASWSPDGQWIAYAGGYGLKKLRVGSGEEPIQVHPENCYYPSWSPSGQWILCPGTSSLKLISPDGTTTRTLGRGGGDAAWSRDGRYIYSLRSEGDRTVLDRVDVASGDTVQIRELPEGFRPSSPVAGARLSVWPDGKSVALSAGAGDADIWILDGFEPPRSFWEGLWPRRQ